MAIQIRGLEVRFRDASGADVPVLDIRDLTLEDGPESLKTWQVDQGQYATRPDEAWDGFFLTRFRKRS